MNLSEVAYRDALGEAVTMPWQADGVVWTDLPRDARDSLNEWRRGQLSLGAWIARWPAPAPTP